MVLVHRLHEDAVIPTYAKAGDAGFDLVAVSDVMLEPGDTKLVPTGLAFEIPFGYEMQIRPRSGLSIRSALRIANSPGTIDSGYRAEVKIIVDNICAIYPGEETQDYADPVSGYYVLSDNEFITDVDVSVPDGTVLIRKGDRIAQGVIAPVRQATFVSVPYLSPSERGNEGFGSTGASTLQPLQPLQ
jgi:dUTP pyrophosphatase